MTAEDRSSPARPGPRRVPGGADDGWGSVITGPAWTRSGSRGGLMTAEDRSSPARPGPGRVPGGGG